MSWSLAEYYSALETLPPKLRQSLETVWGNPEDDPACKSGSFHFCGIDGRRILLLRFNPNVAHLKKGMMTIMTCRGRRDMVT